MATETQFIASEQLRQKVRRVLEEAIRVGRFAFAPAELLERVLVIAEKRLGHEAHNENAVLKFIERLQLDELYLAQACGRGEEVAWEEFARAHFAFIEEFARRSMPGSAEAEDLAQQIVADLWQHGKIRTYEGLSTLRTWLGTVIAHAAVNAIKSAKPIASIQNDTPHELEKHHTVTPDEDASSRKLVVEAVKRTIEGLAPKYKLLLLLYYEQGLTLREMAAVYHVTEASVSRQLKALRERIRQSVQAKIKREFGLSFPAAQELMAHLPADLDFDLKSVLK